jgi:hypothetical protein
LDALREELLLAVFVTFSALLVFLAGLLVVELAALFLQFLLVQLPPMINDPQIQNSANMNHPFFTFINYITIKAE